MSHRPSSRFSVAGLPLTIALVATATVHADSPIAFHELSVLGTSLDLSVNTANHTDAERVRQVVLDEVGRLDHVLSAYSAGSDLARLNATLEPVKVGPELIDVLTRYDQWAAKTNNAFTAQVGGLKALWAKAETDNREPAPADLAAAVESIRSPLWSIDATDSGTVRRLADRPINIDSLGKGFIVSHALDVAKQTGPAVEGILLNIGGDVATTGFGVPGRKIKWTVAVADPAAPADNAKPLCELRLTDLTVATSGHYARHATVGDQTLSHLIDPRTGRPIDATRAGVSSATVIAPDNATANALATSICILGVDDGMKLVKSTPGAECLIVLNGGGRVRSDGFKRFEIPGNDAKAQSPIATTDGARWPDAFVVNVDVPVKPSAERVGERPYVAVWIEDDQQQHVKTLAVWGNEDKWLKEMPAWSKVYKSQPTLLGKVTRATRSAGHYTLAWDGTDQLHRAVPQGTYSVWVEVGYDHGPKVAKSVALVCGSTATSVKLDATEGFDVAPVVYQAR